MSIPLLSAPLLVSSCPSEPLSCCPLTLNRQQLLPLPWLWMAAGKLPKLTKGVLSLNIALSLCPRSGRFLSDHRERQGGADGPSPEGLSLLTRPSIGVLGLFTKSGRKRLPAPAQPSPSSLSNCQHSQVFGQALASAGKMGYSLGLVSFLCFSLDLF